MTREKGYIKYIVIIAVILVLAVLSQQKFFGQKPGNFVSGAVNQAESYVAKGGQWVKQNTYDKLAGQVLKRGELAKQQVTEEKNKISENIFQKAKNYLAGITNSIVHPGTPQNCQTPAVQTTSSSNQ